MSRTTLLLAAAIALAGCRGDGEFDDSALARSGVLSAEVVEAQISVSVVGSAEPLASGGGLPPVGAGGRLSVLLEVENRGTEPLVEVAAGLVDEGGDEGVAPEVLSLDDLAPGERRTVRADWGLRETADPIAVAVAFGRSEARRRAIVPLGRPRGGVVLERIEVAGEGALPERARRFLGRAEADAVGYDALVATGEKMVVEIGLGSSPTRAAVAAQLSIRRRGSPSVGIELTQDVVLDGARRLTLLVDAERAEVGRSEFDLVARYLDGAEVVERAWRLRFGVHALAVIEDGARFRFSFRLPTGASGEWEGPARLAGRPAPEDLGEAVRMLRDRTALDLSAAFRASRLRYDPPRAGAPSEAALRGELARVLGRAAGYALLRTEVKSDLRTGLAGEPALSRALAEKAGDMGLDAGPALLAGALAGWRPAAGEVPLTAAPAAPPEAMAVPAEPFESLQTTGEIALRTAQMGAADPVPVAPGATIRVDAFPLTLAYDVAGVAGAEEPRYELVLLSAGEASASIESRAAGAALEVYVERLEPGTWRAGLVARWESGRTLAGPSFALEVAGARPAEEFPDDLLQMLSPAERARIAEGKSFQKTVAIQREGRFTLSKRQFAIELGKVVDKGDVSIQLVSARYDESRGETLVEFRVTSKVTKTWSFSVAPVVAGRPGASPPPARELSIPMKEGEPETVSFSIPGQLGESFTLLEHTISGSPPSIVGALGVMYSQFSSLAAATASLSAILKASIEANRVEWREIRLDQFEAMGGRIRFIGTGGPQIGIEVVSLPGGMDPSVNLVLLVPGGTRIEGGGDIQELVLPADVRIDLSRLGPGSPPIYASAYCVEKEKPFPTGQKELMRRSGELGGEASEFGARAMDLLLHGGYEGLEGLSPGELQELGQVLVWAFLEIDPGETVTPELAKKFGRAFRVAVDHLPELGRLTPATRRRIAESLNQLFLDALFLTRPPS